MTVDQEFALALYGVPGIGTRLHARLTARFGSPAAVFDAPFDELMTVQGMTAPASERIRSFDRAAFVARQREMLEWVGGRVIDRNEPGYPPLLDAFPSAPPVLFVRGDASALLAPSVAIVGTRGETEYGRRMTRMLAEGLVDAGLTVTSGMAAGVDATAHRAAIARGGRTVAVFGCGLDLIYPVSHRELADEIAANGCLVSHFPMGTPATRGTFPARNAVIVGLSRGTIVVEAGESSGALITAALTRKAGRPLFAVPGNADSEKSRGTNALIAEGAIPITNIEPVLAAVGGHSHTVAVSHTMAVSRPAAVSHTVVVPACSVRNAPPVRTPRPLPEGLPGAILRILESGALHIDSICEESRQPVYLVSTALTDLELDGWVERRPGAVYVRR